MNVEEAIKKLKEGNEAYVKSRAFSADVSEAICIDNADNGQHPYAIVVGCSDSRAIPEVIFNVGVGEIFTIRVAGNVIDSHQLGSIEYAAEHLHTQLVVVLGHTECGAVDAALHHDVDGHIKYIVDDIREAIGEETNADKACKLNVMHSMKTIKSSLDSEITVIGAIYNIRTGVVEFIK